MLHGNIPFCNDITKNCMARKYVMKPGNTQYFMSTVQAAKLMQLIIPN